MDFKELDSFVTIAKVKSFSKAAEKLFLTQPALSNHISKLEKELGITLFERNNKKTELTQAGQQFYFSALEILNQREMALLNLQKYQGKIDGMLQVATSSVPGQYILPDILVGFHKSYPDVTYNLHYYYNSGDVIGHLLSGELDFGFVGCEPESRNLIYEKIADDNLIVIAPNIAPFSEMTSISFDRLLDEPLLLRKEGSATRKAFESALKSLGSAAKQPKVLAHMHNNEMIVLCVKAGLGLSIVSEISVADKVAAGNIKALPIDDYRCKNAFYFVYPKNRSLSPLSMRFKEFVFKMKSDG